jgi:hypothetical protein
MKNGMATWMVVCHHFSSFIPVNWRLSPLSSPPSFPVPTPPTPGSETKEVVVIELKEPVVEAGKTESLSSSPDYVKKEKMKFNENSYENLFINLKLIFPLLLCKYSIQSIYSNQLLKKPFIN